jgi:hypothetical protein
MGVCGLHTALKRRVVGLAAERFSLFLSFVATDKRKKRFVARTKKRTELSFAC